MEVKDFEKKIGGLTIMEVIGRVIKISKEATKSGKPYWKVYVDGQTNPLWAWSFPTIADVKIGDGARFEVEDRKGFLHVVKAEPSAFNVDPEEEDVTGEGRISMKEDYDKADQKKVGLAAYRGPVTRDSKDNPFITRMSALKTAVDYFHLQPDSGPSLEEVVAVATRFVEFVETGE